MKPSLLIEPDTSLPALFAQFPQTRAIFNQYSLRGCGGQNGPAESMWPCVCWITGGLSGFDSCARVISHSMTPVAHGHCGCSGAHDERHWLGIDDEQQYP